MVERTGSSGPALHGVPVGGGPKADNVHNTEPTDLELGCQEKNNYNDSTLS